MKKIVFILMLSVFTLSLFSGFSFSQDFYKRRMLESFRNKESEFLQANGALETKRIQKNTQLSNLIKEYGQSPSQDILTRINSTKSELFTILQEELRNSFQYIKYLENSLAEMLKAK